jgi:hypothetical protein
MYSDLTLPHGRYLPDSESSKPHRPLTTASLWDACNFGVSRCFHCFRRYSVFLCNLLGVFVASTPCLATSVLSFFGDFPIGLWALRAFCGNHCRWRLAVAQSLSHPWREALRVMTQRMRIRRPWRAHNINGLIGSWWREPPQKRLPRCVV